MKVKTNVKAGSWFYNRCDSVRKEKPQSGLKVKTNVKAGGLAMNRCESVVR